MPELDPAARLAEAIEHHRHGRFAEALAAYRTLLEVNPDDPNALNFLGMLHVQHGDTRLGASLIKRATTIAPGYAGAHANLGTALVELGETDDARRSYENALAAEPDHAEAHNNLGVLLRYSDDLHGSLAHLLMATELRPDWATAQMNLGNSFAHTRNHEKAIAAYTKAIESDPRFGDAYRMLGHAFYARGELDKACRVFDTLLSVDPENAIARHMRAAISGEHVPDRASKAYVAATFDSFASSFDEKLARLGYAGPGLVADEVRRRLPEPDGSLRCLDLGAGTGLCAPLVAPWVSELVGVDLSPEMLQRAARRGLYQELVVTDLCDYLAGDVGAFDLMISADVFIYFGALDALMDGIARRLAPGGWLVFTVERSEDDTERGFVLGPSGRYVHTRRYLEDQVERVGLALHSIEPHVLRQEMAEDVGGFVIAARRPGVRD